MTNNIEAAAVKDPAKDAPGAVDFISRTVILILAVAQVLTLVTVIYPTPLSLFIFSTAGVGLYALGIGLYLLTVVRDLIRRGAL